MVLQFMIVQIKMTNQFKINILCIIFSSHFFINADVINSNELALHHFMQGEFLMNQGNYALAILEFQDAIELDPNASTIHVSIADGYRRLGKVKRTEDHLQIALDLDPEEKEAREMLGQLYLTQKKKPSVSLLRVRTLKL